MSRNDRISLCYVIAVLALLIGAMVQTSWSQDGPAALPSRTPNAVIVSPNAPKTISVTDNLQTALAGAQCGDTFLLDPTLVYSGSLTVPTLACDAAHGLTIRSAATVVLDSKGRPQVAQQFPKIILKGSQIVSGGTFVLWDGIEFARVAGTGTTWGLVTLGSASHDIVFDHDYFHGTSTDETVRGLYLQGATNITVQNSVFTEFHCRALGTCGDAQAILGGIGDTATSGNYLIQNNYLEAAGENILMGGGPSSFNVSDVTIQYNDIVKPDSWNPADPSFGGQRWITKNLVEFKNCVRCLVQGNRMIGSWGGYTQTGYGMLIGVKNQNNQCALCMVSDVTVRNNWVSKTGQAMQIMVAPAGGGFQAKEQERISIHDNVFDQLQYPTCYQCGQWLIQLSSDPAAPSVLHDVTITNNTFSVASWARDGGFMNLGGPTGTKMFNINVTNNVFPGGKYPLYSTGGGATNCFKSGTLDYAAGLAGCWLTSSFTGNVVLNNGNVTKFVWPTGNTVVNSGANVVGLKSSLATQIQ